MTTAMYLSTKIFFLLCLLYWLLFIWSLQENLYIVINVHCCLHTVGHSLTYRTRCVHKHVVDKKHSKYFKLRKCFLQHPIVRVEFHSWLEFLRLASRRHSCSIPRFKRCTPAPSSSPPSHLSGVESSPPVTRRAGFNPTYDSPGACWGISSPPGISGTFTDSNVGYRKCLLNTNELPSALHVFDCLCVCVWHG